MGIILKPLINVAKNGEQTVVAHSSEPDAVAVWSKVNCVTSGAPSRLPAGWEKTKRSLYHMNESTSISIWIETADVDFILTCANTNYRSEFRPKRRIKARFPPGFH
jgi:hypothetical protein